jgi:aldose 1-epimerase
MVLGGALFITSCTPKQQQAALTQSGLDPKNFETELDGKQTALYTLTNDNGMEVCITNFGGRIVSIMVLDRDGTLRDVVLGFDNITDYINIPSDFGASIGRYANRIANGQFVLDGDTITLPQNNFGHCLHGGPTGWQYQVYNVRQVDGQSITLDITSPDGDNNFPGTVNASVTYTLTPKNAIDITYSATTDKPTVINMTNHSYFNLNGDPTQSICNNYLTINAEGYAPVDSTYMTTGQISYVEGTPFDFTGRKQVGQDIEADDEQIHNGNGYDHNWVLNTNGDIAQPAVVLESIETGISLTVYTDEPGIQVYTGNFLDGTVQGKHDITYQQRVGICLETQKYPDTPNKPEWPSAVLRPGETYSSHTIFQFGTF